MGIRVGGKIVSGRRYDGKIVAGIRQNSKIKYSGVIKPRLIFLSTHSVEGNKVIFYDLNGNLKNDEGFDLPILGQHNYHTIGYRMSDKKILIGRLNGQIQTYNIDGTRDVGNDFSVLLPTSEFRFLQMTATTNFLWMFFEREVSSGHWEPKIQRSLIDGSDQVISIGPSSGSTRTYSMTASDDAIYYNTNHPGIELRKREYTQDGSLGNLVSGDIGTRFSCMALTEDRLFAINQHSQDLQSRNLSHPFSVIDTEVVDQVGENSIRDMAYIR